MEKKSLSTHENADLFLGMVKLQPEDISIVAKMGTFLRLLQPRSEVRMEKIITCTKCRKTFTVSGPYSGAKEVPQPVTCPFCGEPNEVKWPMDAGFTTIPKKPSASIPA